MPGSQTALGRAGARNNAPVRVAFRNQNSVGAQNDVDFAAQWLACAIPCRRFAGILTDTCARLGADVDCYAFIVVDFTTYSLPVSRRTPESTRGGRTQAHLLEILIRQLMAHFAIDSE